MATTNIKKNAKAYNYKYTDLAQIHEYLEAQGMKYIQQIKRIEGDDYIFTKRFVDGKWEDEWLQGCKLIEATLKGVSNPVQEAGSSISYCRRYSVLLAFGLATTDDDAQAFSVPREEEKAKANLQATYGDGSKPVSDAEKEALKIKCKEVGIDLVDVLSDVGWKKGEKLTQAQYGKAMNLLINESKRGK